MALFYFVLLREGAQCTQLFYFIGKSKGVSQGFPKNRSVLEPDKGLDLYSGRPLHLLVADCICLLSIKFIVFIILSF